MLKLLKKKKDHSQIELVVQVLPRTHANNPTYRLSVPDTKFWLYNTSFYSVPVQAVATTHHSGLAEVLNNAAKQITGALISVQACFRRLRKQEGLEKVV